MYEFILQHQLVIILVVFSRLGSIDNALIDRYKFSLFQCSDSEICPE